MVLSALRAGRDRWGRQALHSQPFRVTLISANAASAGSGAALPSWPRTQPRAGLTWHGALHTPAEPPLLPILPSQNQNLSNHQNIPEASLSLDHLHTIKRAPRPPIVSCSTVEEDNDSGGFDALDLDGRCPADVRGVPSAAASSARS